MFILKRCVIIQFLNFIFSHKIKSSSNILLNKITNNRKNLVNNNLLADISTFLYDSLNIKNVPFNLVPNNQTSIIASNLYEKRQPSLSIKDSKLSKRLYSFIDTEFIKNHFVPLKKRNIYIDKKTAQFRINKTLNYNLPQQFQRRYQPNINDLKTQRINNRYIKPSYYYLTISDVYEAQYIKDIDIIKNSSNQFLDLNQVTIIQSFIDKYKVLRYLGKEAKLFLNSLNEKLYEEERNLYISNQPLVAIYLKDALIIDRVYFNRIVGSFLNGNETQLITDKQNKFILCPNVQYFKSLNKTIQLTAEVSFDNGLNISIKETDILVSKQKILLENKLFNISNIKFDNFYGLIDKILLSKGTELFQINNFSSLSDYSIILNEDIVLENNQDNYSLLNEIIIEKSNKIFLQNKRISFLNTGWYNLTSNLYKTKILNLDFCLYNVYNKFSLKDIQTNNLHIPFKNVFCLNNPEFTGQIKIHIKNSQSNINLKSIYTTSELIPKTPIILKDSITLNSLNKSNSESMTKNELIKINNKSLPLLLYFDLPNTLESNTKLVLRSILSKFKMGQKSEVVFENDCALINIYKDSRINITNIVTPSIRINAFINTTSSLEDVQAISLEFLKSLGKSQINSLELSHINKFTSEQLVALSNNSNLIYLDKQLISLLNNTQLIYLFPETINTSSQINDFKKEILRIKQFREECRRTCLLSN